MMKTVLYLNKDLLRYINGLQRNYPIFQFSNSSIFQFNLHLSEQNHSISQLPFV